uniref:Uncharacterized protein n=1 Tax=Cacopsylla melanoneura TaxID=428564 RepID=A0A8D8W380_9HEMI
MFSWGKRIGKENLSGRRLRIVCLIKSRFCKHLKLNNCERSYPKGKIIYPKRASFSSRHTFRLALKYMDMNNICDDQDGFLAQNFNTIKNLDSRSNTPRPLVEMVIFDYFTYEKIHNIKILKDTHLRFFFSQNNFNK